MPVLYARLEDPLYADLKAVAVRMNIPIRMVTEVILASKLGHEHPLTLAVDQAIDNHRTESADRSKGKKRK